MKIGILGSGAVGQTLSKGFVKYGYPVMIGTRSPEKMKRWSETKGMGVAIGSFDQAASFGDLLVLAINGTHAHEVLKRVSEHLSTKVILDATNPIDGTRPPENGVLHYTTELDSSQLERLQKDFPNARFVKALNSVGAPYMVNPPFDERPTMFICGNSVEAKKDVNSILEKFGWEPQDMGDAEAARAIEPLCMLLCIPGLRNNEWKLALKLLKH